MHGIYCKKHKSLCNFSEPSGVLEIGSNFKAYNVLNSDTTSSILDFKPLMSIPEGHYNFRLLTHGIDFCSEKKMLSDQKDWNMHEHQFSLRVSKINVDSGIEINNKKLDLLKGKKSNGSFIGNLKQLEGFVHEEKLSFKNNSGKTVCMYKLINNNSRLIGYFLKNSLSSFNPRDKTLHSDEGYYDQYSVRYVNKDPKKDTKGYILTGTQNDNYHNIKEGVECLLYRCKQCLDGKVVDDKQNKQKKEGKDGKDG
jgi:hypothetical protein